VVRERERERLRLRLRARVQLERERVPLRGRARARQRGRAPLRELGFREERPAAAAVERAERLRSRAPSRRQQQHTNASGLL